jgi:hypothetical protein
LVVHLQSIGLDIPPTIVPTNCKTVPTSIHRRPCLALRLCFSRLAFKSSFFPSHLVPDSLSACSSVISNARAAMNAPSAATHSPSPEHAALNALMLSNDGLLSLVTGLTGPTLCAARGHVIDELIGIAMTVTGGVDRSGRIECRIKARCPSTYAALRPVVEPVLTRPRRPARYRHLCGHYRHAPRHPCVFIG